MFQQLSEFGAVTLPILRRFRESQPAIWRQVRNKNVCRLHGVPFTQNLLFCRNGELLGLSASTDLTRAVSDCSTSYPAPRLTGWEVERFETGLVTNKLTWPKGWGIPTLREPGRGWVKLS